MFVKPHVLQYWLQWSELIKRLFPGQGGPKRKRQLMYYHGRELGVENEVDLELNLP